MNNKEIHIIVAEDEAINRLYLSTILKKTGYVVDQASNGQEVLDLWQKKRYHLILMDINMPVLDGIETAKRIRAQERKQFKNSDMTGLPPRIPIIPITAHAFSEEKIKCEEAGMDTFITKPVEEHKLFTAIRQFIPHMEK